MATISTLVDRKESVSSNLSPVGVFFTAPFDCIIGIEIHLSHSAGGQENGIHREKKYNNATIANVTLSTTNPPGTKISSVIMKSGESLRFDGYRLAAYITGVSA